MFSKILARFFKQWTALFVIAVLPLIAVSAEIQLQKISKTCSNALSVSTVFPRNYSDTEIEEFFEKRMEKELQGHGPVQGWVTPFYWYLVARKQIYRRLNQKHVNYTFLDDIRTDAEIVVNPTIQTEIDKRGRQWSQAQEEIPAHLLKLHTDHSLDAAMSYHQAMDAATDAKNLYVLATGGWWKPRRRIKNVIKDVLSYSERLRGKIHQAVANQLNENILFHAVLRSLIKKKSEFPLAVELFEYEDDKIVSRSEIITSKWRLISEWRKYRIKRQRIYRTFFSKGELGEMAENYAIKHMQLMSIKARLEAYEKHESFGSEAKKFLNQIRDIEKQDLLHPSYIAQLWVNHAVGRREAQTFFKGEKSEIAKKSISRASDRSMPQGELEELFRTLEINDLASFWGRVRGKLLYGIVAAAIPLTFSIDGAVEAIEGYAANSWQYVESRLGNEDLPPKDTGLTINPANNDIEQVINFQKQRLFVAGLADSKLLKSGLIELTKKHMNRSLTYEEHLQIQSVFRPQKIGDSTHLKAHVVSLKIKNQKLHKFYFSFWQLRLLLDKSRESMNEADYSNFIESLLMQQIGAAVTNRYKS